MSSSGNTKRCKRLPFAVSRVQSFKSVWQIVILPVQYMSNVDSWCKACGEVDLPSELQDLEDAIHHHQGLSEHITAAYSEVTSHFIYADDVLNQ